MSFTLTAPSAELATAMHNAANKDVLCIAAAGNTGLPNVGNPANLHYVMGVASTSNADTRSTFSTYGKGVFVAAPGDARGVVDQFVACTWGGTVRAAAGVVVMARTGATSASAKAIVSANGVVRPRPCRRRDLVDLVGLGAVTSLAEVGVTAGRDQASKVRMAPSFPIQRLGKSG